MELCAELGGPELSKFDAGLALEPQQTAEVKVTARAAADLLRPGPPSSAQSSTRGLQFIGGDNLFCMSGRFHAMKRVEPFANDG